MHFSFNNHGFTEIKFVNTCSASCEGITFIPPFAKEEGNIFNNTREIILVKIVPRQNNIY